MSCLDAFKRLIHFDDRKVYSLRDHNTFDIERYQYTGIVNKDEEKYMEYFAEEKYASWLKKEFGRYWLTDEGFECLANILHTNLIIKSEFSRKEYYTSTYVAEREFKKYKTYFEKLEHDQERKHVVNNCDSCPFLESHGYEYPVDICPIWGEDEPPKWAMSKDGEGCNLSPRAIKHLTKLGSRCDIYCNEGYEIPIAVEAFEKKFREDFFTGKSKEFTACE